MNKILRTLTLSDEVSLVMIDATELVNDAIAIHHLSPAAAVSFGKAMIAMTYLAGWLKDPTGEISANIKGNGTGGLMSISGDASLNMRGTIASPTATGSAEEVVGSSGYMTIVRDDGYKQPFVGTVEFFGGKVEEIFSDYYEQSEQLPTFIKEDILLSEQGRCEVAVGLFLQPLPYSSPSSIEQAKSFCSSADGLGREVKQKGVLAYADEHFTHAEWEERTCAYRCKCSRQKIEGLLLSMDRADLDDILQTDGKVNVHCHYCNTDYDFYKKDIDELFSKR